MFLTFTLLCAVLACLIAGICFLVYGVRLLHRGSQPNTDGPWAKWITRIKAWMLILGSISLTSGLLIGVLFSQVCGGSSLLMNAHICSTDGVTRGMLVGSLSAYVGMGCFIVAGVLSLRRLRYWRPRRNA